MPYPLFTFIIAGFFRKRKSYRKKKEGLFALISLFEGIFAGIPHQQKRPSSRKEKALKLSEKKGLVALGNQAEKPTQGIKDIASDDANDQEKNIPAFAGAFLVGHAGEGNQNATPNDEIDANAKQSSAGSGNIAFAILEHRRID
jgi:hypothetical protein